MKTNEPIGAPVFVMSSGRVVHRVECGTLRNYKNGHFGRLEQPSMEGVWVVHDRRVTETELHEAIESYRACKRARQPFQCS